MYQKLVAFSKANGHTRVPQVYGDDPPLGRWVKRQRFEHTLYCQANEDKAMDAKFSTHDLKQKSNKRQNHLNGKQSSAVFSRRNSTLKITPGRIAKLNAVGFEFDLGQVVWDKMYGRLKDFYEKNGHSQVPKGYAHDVELANWVRNQKLGGNKRKLSQHRVQLLNAVKFPWKRNKSGPGNNNDTHMPHPAVQRRSPTLSDAQENSKT